VCVHPCDSPNNIFLTNGLISKKLCTHVMLLEATPARTIQFPACINTYELRAKIFRPGGLGAQTNNNATAPTDTADLDILLTVHLSIIYFSLFPTRYTVFRLRRISAVLLSSVCFRPHRPIIRRSKLYMQPMVFSS